MKIHLERFAANNPELTVDDVIRNIRAGVTEKGTVNVHFETADKYIDVDANGTVYGPDYKGQTIRLHPNLWVMGDDGVIRYLEGDDDEFYEHPDYWYASLVVDTENDERYDSTVIPLKHEYFVSYVPDSEVMNHDCLGDVEIIEWVE